MNVRVVFALVVAAVVGVGCSTEGPAARIFLQVVRADPGLDTTDVTGFVVIVGGARSVVSYDPDAPTLLELEAPPATATPFVVYACTTRNAACRETDAEFVGCTVVDLVASEGGVPVVVGLEAISPLPEACVGVEGAPAAPVG